MSTGWPNPLYCRGARNEEKPLRRITLVLLLLYPLAGHAQPLFMKDSLGDREFFRPWGVGVDIYTMDQDYSLRSLAFVLPGVDGIDPDTIDVSNEMSHIDVKLDAWVTPFLNVFALVGHMQADTLVDFGGLAVPGLPVSLGELTVKYDGMVYGGGFNLVYGTDRWFASLNNTWVEASLSGDFDSSVSSFTSQPRIGLVRNSWVVWGGAMYLDTEEIHRGEIRLPINGLPPVPFRVDLDTMEKWNYAVGIGYVFSPQAHLSLELGFGDREHTLFNFTGRF